MDLVTGATGFIGSHLAERLLDDGETVRVLVREGSESKLTAKIREHAEIVKGDLRDRDSLFAAAKGVSRIFHCAGYVLDWGKAEIYDDANIRGTQWLFEAAEEAKIDRLVHFSSIAVFGTPSPPKFDDDSPFGSPKDSYTRTKIEGERVAERFMERGMDVVVLRPAVVYGPRGTWLEEPLAMIEKNKMFLLGGGVGTCHPCYIVNLVDATMLAATKPEAKGRAYIVGDGHSISFREYFDGVAKVAGRGPIQRSIPLAVARMTAGVMELGAKVTRSDSRPLLTKTALDMVTTKSEMGQSRITKELNFQPRYDFATAIEELAAARRIRGDNSQS